MSTAFEQEAQQEWQEDDTLREENTATQETEVGDDASLQEPEGGGDLEAGEEEEVETTTTEIEAKTPSPVTIARAVKAGMAPEHIAAFSDEASLNQAATLLEITQQSQQAATQEEDSTESEPFKLALDEEEFSPQLIEQLNALQGHYEDRIAAMESQLTQNSQAFQEWQNTQLLAQTDEAISRLDETLEPILGKGATANLTPGSPELQNRTQLFTAMDALSNTNPGATEDELMNMAARALFGEQLQQQTSASVRKNVRQQLRDQSGKFATRPDKRASESLSPEEKAVARVEKAYAEAEA